MPHGDEGAAGYTLFHIDGDARRLALRDDRARSATPTAASARVERQTLRIRSLCPGAVDQHER